MPDLRRLGLAALLIAGPALAHTVPAQPPPLTIPRYDEDWSVLADPAIRTGAGTEPLKYIPLTVDAYLTTGVELRLRNETFRANLWGDGPAPDDGYLWARAMPYADLHVDLHGGAVRGFVQPILGYALGVAPAAGPIDQTRADLLQAFVDVTFAGVTLRGGRQMLSLGTERLIGTRYGPNVPLAFDGARVIVRRKALALTLLRVRPVQPGPASFDDRASPSKQLWGGYAGIPGLDAYYLGYRNDRARFDSGGGDEHRASFGLRSFGTRGPWHWNVEGIVQRGRFAAQRIRAWSVGAEAGRSFPAARFRPDVTIRVNVVSGDRDRKDGTLGTFNALFPKGKYFGELSPVGPYNIVNANPGVSFDLGGGVSAGAMAQFYWRYARGDGVYDVPGTLIRAAGTARRSAIGRQVEALAGWQATPELTLSASLSAFAAGAFLRETGPARTIVMLGLEANYRF